MAKATVKRGQDGKHEGLTERDQKAYAKFLARVRTLGDSCIQFEWKEPRSGAYHRRHFAMLHALFSTQDQFSDEDQFRKWLEVGAGFCDFVPGPKGRMVAIPKSIAWDKLDQAEFEPLHDGVFGFARSEHARRFLWGHLSDQESWEMVEAALGEFY